MSDNKTVDLLYQGDSKIHFICEGKAPQHNIAKGDLVTGVPAYVYERDLKNDSRYKLLKEKKNQNKMEQSTKGGE